MVTVDLARLTKDEVSMLTGHERGVQARALFSLDSLEAQDDVVRIVAPTSLDTITPSFVQGFLARSISELGRDQLLSKYDFSTLPAALREDFVTGIERLTMHARRISALS
jgi:hypothetical protein